MSSSSSSSENDGISGVICRNFFNGVRWRRFTLPPQFGSRMYSYEDIVRLACSGHM